MKGADLRGAKLINSELFDVDVTGAQIDASTNFEATPWWTARGWSDAQWAALKKAYPREALPRTDGYKRRLGEMIEFLAEENFLRRAWFRAVRGVELDLALEDARGVSGARAAAIEGYILLQLDKPEQALERLRSINSNEIDPSVLYHLGLAYEAAGEDATAKIWFAEAEKSGYKPSYERLLTPRKSMRVR